MLLASMPLTVAMAQDIVPKGRSMISSLMMGFAFGLGGMLTPRCPDTWPRYTAYAPPSPWWPLCPFWWPRLFWVFPKNP